MVVEMHDQSRSSPSLLILIHSILLYWIFNLIMYLFLIHFVNSETNNHLSFLTWSLLCFNILVNDVEFLKESLEELMRADEVRATHHLSYGMHRELRHAYIDRSNASISGEDWSNSRSTRTVVTH